MSSLLFIDTNIYLDFYRYSNDVSLSLLNRVDENRNMVVTTAEVEMEFMKNRQEVILKALADIKPQNSTQLNIPSFLKESKYKETSLRLTKQWENFANKITRQTEKLLESPGRYDPVYKILQRLFKEEGTCHLNRGEKMKRILESAQKRFTLGYPPRKAHDTSIGDAINWEWIVYCAKNSHSDIVIISRDTDYGQHRKKKAFINDWLLQEFKERVGRTRSIKLTSRLAEGFRLAGITVPEEEDQAEQKFITEAEIQAIPKFEVWQPGWTINVPGAAVAGVPNWGIPGGVQLVTSEFPSPVMPSEVDFNSVVLGDPNAIPKTTKVTSPIVSNTPKIIKRKS